MTGSATQADAGGRRSACPLPVAVGSLPTRLALGAIRLYQCTIAHLLPPACRFWPSCSRYGYEAIARHGIRRGGWMTIRRLSRCHPFNPGGYDPVR